MSFRSLPRAAVLPLALLAFLPAPVARANFVLVSQVLTLDRPDHRADFTLTFNQQPNFITTDHVGRQANSFQIEFEGNSTDLTAIIRGEEIHLAHAVRVRAPTGNGGPGSGGWGPILESSPYIVDNNTVSFSTTTDALGLVGPTFLYDAYSLEYGSLTAIHEVQFVPLPDAMEMFPAGAMVVGIVTWRLRRKFE